MVIMKFREIFSNNLWKTKAVVRRKKLNLLEKRNKELIKSRDKAKKKNEKLRLKNIELEEKVSKLKNELKKN